MVQFETMGKTELSIVGLTLENANLPHVADKVAEVLGIDRSELLVTDVRGDNLVLDILRRSIDPRNIVGKEKELLAAIGKVEGVTVNAGARVDSRGLLSWVSADSVAVAGVLESSSRVAGDLRDRLTRSVVVFPTGTELGNGQVQDTNTPLICDRLTAEGFAVSRGNTLRDDEYHIAANLRERAQEGYGMIITSGGVGAEVKDRTIEAVLLVDPEAATPTIVQYELGVGRHVHKNAVRIAVGRCFETLIVALPGPTDEVLLGIDALVKGLKAGGLGKAELAEQIAFVLRRRLHDKAHA